ncbi:MAG: hypothetical protein NTY19_25870 [Planctomycetota bacterium]|nr:hypothetical protein [Planctomycetota bacterium]
MVLTIDLTPDLESKLREVAAAQGVEPREYVVETLRQHLGPALTHPPCQSAAESKLFDEINQGLSEWDWSRYRQLIEKRRAEQLTAEEHVELTAISDRVEELNVRRLELLSELARLRNTTLPTLMDQLGLQPDPVT